jgi:tetratricopeptide (TPR) repeat protein
MNTQQLLTFLHTPENLGKDAGALLDRLTREFPYFQTAQLLYVKSLHNDNSFLYNNQLKLAAAYATDRKVLYELIRKKASEHVQPETKTETKAVTETVVPESTVSSTEKAIAAADLVQDTPVQTETPAEETERLTVQLTASQLIKARLNNTSDEWDESVLRQLQLLRHWQKDPTAGMAFTFPKKEQPKVQEEPVAELKTETPVAEPVIETGTVEITTPANDQVTEKEQLQELLTVLIDSDSEDVTAPDETEIQLLNQLPDEREEGLEYEVISLQQDEQATESIEKTIEKPADPVEQEILFKAIGSSIELEVSDTLPSADELLGKTTEIPEAEEKPAKEITASDDALTFASWLKQLGKNQPVQEQPETEEENIVPDLHKEQNKLIDNFIEAAPRITPQKAAFYNPANMAKKSVTEDNELISETLAQIYEKQGNYPKAIRAYQRLSLKYPEKSIYFASLIEKLKSTPNKNTK